MPSFTYEGREVIVARTADMMACFRPGGSQSHRVQAILDQMPSWREGEDPIESMEFRDLELPPLAVDLNTVTMDARSRMWWAIHERHMAKNPGLSPFVMTTSPRKTDLVTIELTGTPRRPVMTRAYTGDYTPPLPWMSSARNADGGRQGCLTYWRNHAFLPGGLGGDCVYSSLTIVPPDWYRS